MQMKVTTIRLPMDILVKLRTLAHVESLKRHQEVSWAMLIREAIDQHVLSGKSDDDVPCLLGKTAGEITPVIGV